MQPVSRKQWQSLFSLADDLWAMKPWKWLEETDIFGINVLNFPQTGWVSVLGSQEQHFALTIYLGDEGLKGYWNFQQNPNPLYVELLQIPLLQVSFEPRTDLHTKDVQVIKSLNKSPRDKEFWPIFRSFQFGHPPWFLEKNQANYMIAMLEQTHSFFPQIKNDIDKLYPGKDEYTFLIRQQVQSDNNQTWQNQTLSLDPESRAEPDYLISDFQIQRLTELPLANHSIQADVLMLPSPVEGKEQPFFPFICILLDIDSGMVVGEKMLDTPKDRPSLLSAFANALVEEIITLKSCPESIILQYPRLVNYLNQIPDVPFNVFHEQEMSEMRDFYEHMIEFMNPPPLQ